MSPEDKDIKFPTTHYVGFQTRPSADGVPLGFMTPDGTDSAAKKRKETVDKWAAGYGYYGKNEGKLPAKTFDNKPMNGFKLGRDIRHGGGWGQGSVKWRIEDPRGFELEISSPNLAKIMACTTIENGEILEQCMWARLKAENVLIPVSSDVYKAAQSNTERLNKKVSMKDVKLGDHVIMQNGSEGTYLGQYWVGLDGVDYYGIKNETTMERKYHFFEISTGSLSEWRAKQGMVVRMVADPKIAELTPCETALDFKEAEAKINAHANAGGYFETASTSYGNDPDFVYGVQGKKPETTVTRTLEAFDLTKLLASGDTSNTMVIFNNGYKWCVAQASQIVARPVHAHAHALYTPPRFDFHAFVFDMDAYKADGSIKTKTELTRSYYGREQEERAINTEVKHSDIKPDGFVIRVTGDTTLGNRIDYLANK